LSNLKNSDELVRKQYNNAGNLNTRINLHSLFSTNKQGFAPWVFQQYDLRQNQRILELGCGNGGIWKLCPESVSAGLSLVLSDLSEGMLNDTKENLKDLDFVEYKVIDAQDIPYAAGSLDIVIANHMLYHVPDMDKALGEIARVLKPDGVLYATTIGFGNMAELTALLHAFDPRIDFALQSAAEKFGLETGEAILNNFFRKVETLRYVDSLHITEAEPLAEYVLSSQGIGNVNEIIAGNRVREFGDYLAGIIGEKGCIDIRKDAGIFIAREPL
jgi:SAM-dependent methyltransferase